MLLGLRFESVLVTVIYWRSGRWDGMFREDPLLRCDHAQKICTSRLMFQDLYRDGLECPTLMLCYQGVVTPLLQN